ncbi:MAG: hypothetical protein IJX11_09815 [Bacteroidales bacterium]|nr:hypothetical protein [Bacteroidales bacterium]MBQ9167371.1 hypothetical protein [Oscillospiraceae bacterium]
MVTFGEITEKRVRALYTKTDIEGYSVEGGAAYDMDNGLTDASGIVKADGAVVGHFGIWRNGEGFSMNISDFSAGSGAKLNEIAEAVLSDLESAVPEA